MVSAMAKTSAGTDARSHHEGRAIAATKGPTHRTVNAIGTRHSPTPSPRGGDTEPTHIFPPSSAPAGLAISPAPPPPAPPRAQRAGELHRAEHANLRRPLRPQASPDQYAVFRGLRVITVL